MIGSSPGARTPVRHRPLQSIAASLALLAAVGWLCACRSATPAAAVASPSLPDDVPTWPAARFEAVEEIPQLGRLLRYACDASPAEVADFYSLQLRQRGWQVQRAPADPQAKRSADAATSVEFNAAKAGRGLGLSVQSRRRGCEIELLLLDSETAGPSPPAL